MKRIIYLLIILISFSCKKTEKNNVIKEQPKSAQVKKEIDKDIKAIQQGLNNFWEVEIDNGFKLIVNNDKIYYLKENPTDIDTNTRFFLHVTLQSGEILNMDFNYLDHTLKSKEQSSFKNYAVAHIELPQEPIFSISTGQFNDTGRLWQQVLHEQNFY